MGSGDKWEEVKSIGAAAQKLEKKMDGFNKLDDSDLRLLIDHLYAIELSVVRVRTEIEATLDHRSIKKVWDNRG